MLEFFTGDKIFESLLFQILLIIPGAIIFYVIMQIKPLHRVLSKPMDFGITFRGKRLFGANKTWRTPVSLFFGFLLGYWAVQPFVEKYDYVFDYLIVLKKANLFLVVLLVSFGAEFGEVLNSFVKRQLGKKPGEEGGIIQKFFDQVDVFWSMCFFLSIFVKPIPFYFFAWGTIQGFGLHLLYTYIVKRKLKIYPKNMHS